MRTIYPAIGLFLLVGCLAAEKEPLGPDLVKRARKIQVFCQKKTNISNELLQKSRQNIFPSDRAMQCFLQCNLDTGGMMNSKNEISLEPLKAVLPESWHEIITQLEEKCGTKGGADACEVAYNTFLCYAEHNKEPMIV